MKIFFSYGHDEHAEFIKKIKTDLSKHQVEAWLDSEQLKANDDWEQKLEDAIEQSNDIVYFITPYSARRPDGYCLNELAFSIANGKRIIPVMLDYTTPPLSICRIQYIDIQHLRKDFDEEEYKLFLTELKDILFCNKDQNYEGEHLNLLTQLKPIDFSADFKKNINNFIGREWLYEKVDSALQNQKNQIIWIKAEAGFGKTAFSTYLQYKHANAVGIHYCQFDSIKRKSSLNVLKTLIFQLSTQIPQYNEILSYLNLNMIENKTENEILEEFLLEPLNKLEVKHNYFFIIDAIDEAIENGKNKLADLIQKFTNLPSWMKIVITSRPEPYLIRKFSKLKTISINTNSEDNYKDLYLYIDNFSMLDNCSILKKQDLQETLVHNCEGNILYLKEIINAVNEGEINEHDIKKMPKGMDGLYINMFERYFENLQDYKQLQRPLFELMSIVRTKISLSFISLILEWDDYELEDALDPIGSIIEIKDNYIKFFHKSIADWITDRQRSGRDFYVSKQKGYEKIVELILKKDIRYIQKIANNFDDILIIFNALYTIAYKALDIDNAYVQEIYNKIILIRTTFYEEENFKEILTKNGIEGELDFILDLTKIDFEISKILIDIDQQYINHHILASKNYAHSLKELGKIDSSIQIQEYITKKLKELYNENENKWNYAYADILNVLAQSYSSIGKMQEAINHDTESLKITENTQENKNHTWQKLYTGCLSSLAVSYGNFNQINTAISLEEKANHILEELYTQNNSLWVNSYIRSLNNLAIAYKDIGNTKIAKQLEEQFLEIIKPLYKLNKAQWINDYALVLNNLAFTYKSIGIIDTAMELEQEALKVTKAQYKINKGYWTHLYIKSLLNLALSYKNMWLIEEAIELEETALEITNKLYKQDKLRWVDVYTRTLTSLAISLSKINKYEDAKKFEDLSLSIRESLFENNPQRWIDAYTLSSNNSAITYKKLGFYEVALNLLSKNLDIRMEYYNSAPQRWSDHYTESLVNKATFHLMDKEISKAHPLLQEALNIKEPLFQQNPDLWIESYAKNLSLIGYSYYVQNDFEQAIPFLKKSLSSRQELYNKHKSKWVYPYMISLVLLSINYLKNLQINEAKIMQKKLHIAQEENQISSLKIWFNKYFQTFLDTNLESDIVNDDLLQLISSNMLELEFLQKKSPHRWSDAFK